MWETLRKEDILQKLRTKQGVGLSQREVLVRKQKYGSNKLEEKKKETLLVKFIKQFNDFMIIILIIASILSAVTSYFQGENDYVYYYTPGNSSFGWASDIFDASCSSNVYQNDETFVKSCGIYMYYVIKY